jgi:hypothetical protein
MTIVGLIAIAAGSFILSIMPATLGIPGYIAPLVVITVGYALFQTANNTAVMTDIRPSFPACSTHRAISGSSPVHRLWVLCSRSHRRRSTSQRRVPRPSPSVADHVRSRGDCDRLRDRDRPRNLPPHIARSGTCSGRGVAGGQERLGMTLRRFVSLRLLVSVKTSAGLRQQLRLPLGA